MNWSYVSKGSGMCFNTLTLAGDLNNSRFMAGLERVPNNIEWKDPAWSHNEQVRAVWENEKMSSVLTFVGSISHDADTPNKLFAW